MEENNTSQNILKAAEEEFLEKGFAGARTTSIAQKAGVTHAMLHYYFRTKDQLFAMIVRDKLSELMESFLSIFEDTSLPLEERIEKGISVHFDFISRNPRLPRFFVTEHGKLDIEVLRPYFTKLMEVLARTGKDLSPEADIDPFHLFLDILSQNIFPFLVMPFAQKAGIVGTNASVWLESIKQENIIIIKKRLGFI